MVLLRGSGERLLAGQVWAHLEIAGEPVSLVSVWGESVTASEAGCAEWTMVEQPELFLAEDMLAPVAWASPSGGGGKLLVPRQYL